jgi:RNA polymerase sigma-70 factor (ECF subfamily)
MSDVSDETIAETVQQGDAEAYGDLITRYEAKLKRYARKFLNRQEDIEDLVQDVFVKAYINLQSFDTSQRFSPWIYRIAHNTFVNELRRKDRQGFGVFDADTIFSLIAAKETADGEALAAEVEAEMDTLVETLPSKYREVILLHYFEDLSYQEISDVLRIPVNTVGVRMTRARKKLKETYERNHHTT